MPGSEPANSLRISQLTTVAAPVPLTAKLPVVIGGATRVVNLSSFLNSVTGGTVTSVSAGTNVRMDPSTITTTGTISFHLPGLVIPYAGASAPDGWVFCNGTFYPIDGVYSELFGVIGYTYGGSGNSFSVPDLRGRIPFGKAADALSESSLNGAVFDNGNFYSLGSSGGRENHLLAYNQSAVKDHVHSASGTMTVFGACDDTACWDDKDCPPPECFSDYGVLGEVGPGTSQSSSSTASSLDLFGVNAALSHNNMPPGLVLNYIIKL
ncbi:hypothetical protein EBX31_00810 [bacterium]|nr:hypothetical protein [bacterium]